MYLQHSIDLHDNDLHKSPCTLKFLNVDYFFVFQNLSFPLPISYTPDSRSLIPAPGVLDGFRDWINTTELPDHDHALFFTGFGFPMVEKEYPVY